MMTLDEAINHCEEVALSCNDNEKQCALEHVQLIQWLKELRALRKLVEHDKKSVDKVEPKLKVGNWYQCTKDFFGKGVTFDKNTAYYCAKEGCLQNEYECHIAIVKDLYDNFKLWTIQDVKSGDVLAFKDDSYILLVKEVHNTIYGMRVSCYCHVLIGKFETVEYQIRVDGLYPATKEQRDTLFQKMKEAGYEWDFKKKELRKIKPQVDGFDAELNALLKKYEHLPKEELAECLSFYLGVVQGNECDEEIVEAVKNASILDLIDEQKPKWSEEDDRNLRDIISAVHCVPYQTSEDEEFRANWLKSLKKRMEEQQ